MALYQCTLQYGMIPMHVHALHYMTWYQCMSQYCMVPMHAHHPAWYKYVTLWHDISACYTMK